jgi:hypothetical protein
MKALNPSARPASSSLVPLGKASHETRGIGEIPDADWTGLQYREMHGLTRH